MELTIRPPVFNYRFKNTVSMGTLHPSSKIITDKSIMMETEVVSSNAKKGLSLPIYLDLRPYCGKVINQDDLPCGVSSTVSTAVSLLHNLCNDDRWLISKMFGYNRKPTFEISRLHNYWNSKIYEYTPIHDFGSIMLESSLITVKERRICPETIWGYDKELIDVQPKLSVDLASGGYPYNINYKILSDEPNLDAYANSVELIKSELYHHHPVVVGIVLFDNWNSNSNGLIPVPEIGKDKLIGSHTITIVGYNNRKKYFIFQNTLGEIWGSHGFGTIEYEYISNSDFCGDVYSLYI